MAGMARFSPLKLPKAHDGVRLLEPQSGPTVDGTAAAMRCFYDPGGGPSLYAEVKALVPDAFGRRHPLPALEAACQGFRTDLARRLGVGIIRAVWGVGADGMRVKPMGVSWPYEILPGLPLLVEADFIMREGDQACVVWVQPRLTHVPDRRQLGLLCRLFMIAAQLRGQDDVGFRVLDLHEGTAIERRAQLLKPDDLDVPDEAKAHELMQILADAYRLLMAEGYQRPARRLRPQRGQDDLFPPPA